jgi:hypothetical protein
MFYVLSGSVEFQQSPVLKLLRHLSKSFRNIAALVGSFHFCLCWPHGTARRRPCVSDARAIAWRLEAFASLVLIHLNECSFLCCCIDSPRLSWKLGFIGGTTMLTDCYRLAEPGKVQAANDFGISFQMAVASTSPGQLLACWGWDFVAWALLPSPAIALALVAWLAVANNGNPTRQIA